MSLKLHTVESPTVHTVAALNDGTSGCSGFDGCSGFVGCFGTCADTKLLLSPVVPLIVSGFITSLIEHPASSCVIV